MAVSDNSSLAPGPYASAGYTTAVLVHSHGCGYHWFLYNSEDDRYESCDSKEHSQLTTTGMINDEIFAYYDCIILPPGVDLMQHYSGDEMTTMHDQGLVPQAAFYPSASPVGIKAVDAIGEAPDFVSFGDIYSGTVSMPYKYEGSKKLYSPTTGSENDAYSGGSTQRAGCIGGTFEIKLPSNVNLQKQFTKELIEDIKANPDNIPENYFMTTTDMLFYKIHGRNVDVIEQKGIALGETATQNATAASTSSGALAAKIESNKVASSVINSAW